MIYDITTGLEPIVVYNLHVCDVETSQTLRVVGDI